MAMGTPVGAMRVFFAGFDGDEVEMTVPDPGFRRQLVGKLPHRARIALQDHRLEAILVIEMHVHRRDGEVVSFMLTRRESFGERPLMMVVHERERGDAAGTGLLLLATSVESIANQIAHGFAAILVTVFANELIESGRKFVIDGNRYSLHDGASSSSTK